MPEIAKRRVPGTQHSWEVLVAGQPAGPVVYIESTADFLVRWLSAALAAGRLSAAESEAKP